MTAILILLAFLALCVLAAGAGGEHAEGQEGQEDEDRCHASTVPAQGLSAQMDVLLDSIMEPDSWLGVEIRHFAALQALADEGSFGRERLQGREVANLD